MKTAIFSGIAAIVLSIAGVVCWSASRVERGMVEARRSLARLSYADAVRQGDEIENRRGIAGLVPMTTDAIDRLREQRATAQYWLARYPMLAPPRDPEGTLLEHDPGLLFLGANAAFRATDARQDRQVAIKQLDAVLKAYADVLKSSPQHVDAAYNFEYVARLRDTLAHPTQQPKIRPEAPLGPPTVHGLPGAFPVGTDMSQFKVVVPKQGEEKPQGDERKDAPGATAGKEKVRKG